MATRTCKPGSEDAKPFEKLAERNQRKTKPISPRTPKNADGSSKATSAEESEK